MKVKSESKVAQSCPTPSDPMDCSPPGSSVHGSFQARVLEWGATVQPKIKKKKKKDIYWQTDMKELLFLDPAACRILVPQPGIELVPCAVGA